MRKSTHLSILASLLMLATTSHAQILVPSPRSPDGIEDYIDPYDPVPLLLDASGVGGMPQQPENIPEKLALNAEIACSLWQVEIFSSGAHSNSPGAALPADIPDSCWSALRDITNHFFNENSNEDFAYLVLQWGDMGGQIVIGVKRP